MKAKEIIAVYHPSPTLGTDYRDEAWRSAVPMAMGLDWRGIPAPPELATTAYALWNERELFLGYECRYAELDMDDVYDLNEERHALWDRDVCEAFIRSPIEPHEKHYREFEVAPTGQWCDLIIDRTSLSHDWEWRSGMRTASEIEPVEKIWRATMAIPFAAFGTAPRAGDVWHGNLFRIGRINGERQYLAYSPTFTEIPSFHVAEAFVEMRFEY